MCAPSQLEFSWFNTAPQLRLEKLKRRIERASLVVRLAQTKRQLLLDLKNGKPRQRGPVSRQVLKKKKQLEVLTNRPTVKRPPNTGGPDLDKPCDGCPKHSDCKEPCVLLAGLLSEPEIIAWNEIGSIALMEGRGNLDVVMTHPITEWYREPEPEERWPHIVDYYAPKIRENLHVLTQAQKMVVEALLEGIERHEMVLFREVSRQAVHKVYHGAVKRLRKALGELPDDVDLLRAA